MTEKTALIIGITGQDGSYLAEFLLARGYSVHGLVRRASLFNRSRIEHLRNAPGGQAGKLFLHYGDLNDLASLRRVLHQAKPAEVYYLAGQSHVGLSFELPEVTCQENAMAALGVIEMLRELGFPVRFYHAASSEMFGVPTHAPQTEETPFNPVNPYGCAKAFATQLCRVYRQSYGLFICSGIAYNHESPRRGENFVTRKISMGAVRIQAGQQAELRLGNLGAARDWGYAVEYVVAMWRMLQAGTPRDYVLATGTACTVRDFLSAAFAEAGLELEFEGKGVTEVGRRKDTGRIVVRVDARFFRPVESAQLVGDASLARQALDWSAQQKGADLARLMVKADREALGAVRAE